MKGGRKAMHCIHCFREFKANPRVKKQKYCGDKKCQRARRRAWQRRKVASDPDYQENQRRCQRQWQEGNPGYYRLYRNSHPEYTQRNRLLQGMRNVRRRNDKQGKMIAKMDSLIRPYYSRRGAIFRIIPQDDRLIANMDSLEVKLVPIQGLRNRL
jgi:hypothetical protein